MSVKSQLNRNIHLIDQNWRNKRDADIGFESLVYAYRIRIPSKGWGGLIFEAQDGSPTGLKYRSTVASFTYS